MRSACGWSGTVGYDKDFVKPSPAWLRRAPLKDDTASQFEMWRKRVDHSPIVFTQRSLRGGLEAFLQALDHSANAARTVFVGGFLFAVVVRKCFVFQEFCRIVERPAQIHQGIGGRGARPGDRATRRPVTAVLGCVVVLGAGRRLFHTPILRRMTLSFNPLVWLLKRVVCLRNIPHGCLHPNRDGGRAKQPREGRLNAEIHGHGQGECSVM